MDTVYTPNAPQAIGPYSQGVCAGSLVFTSGQIAIDPVTGQVVAATITEQTEQVCKNLEAVLVAAGSSLAQVIKTTCFLSSMAYSFLFLHSVMPSMYSGITLNISARSLMVF